MRYKPWQFKVLALIFLVIAISLPLQMMIIYEHGFSQIDLVFQKLTLLNKVVMGLCFVNAFLTYRASKFVLVTIPLAIITVMANNYYVSVYGQDFPTELTYVATISFLVLPSLLLFSRPWQILMHPEKQWWRNEQRFNIQLPIQVFHGTVQTLKSVDISVSGMFLSCTKNLFEDQSLVEVVLPVGESENICLVARVVRKTDARGKYPEGIGFQFLNTSIKEKHLLRSMLSKS